MNGLLDTSVLVDLVPETLPDDVAISVVSIAELRLGVLLARDVAGRAARLARVTEVERLFDPLPVDGDVASAYAEIVAAARDQGRRPRALDALIAATAVVHGLTLYTRDRDFQHLPRVQVKLLP
jgi:predicted nucleic acid-binding protein